MADALGGGIDEDGGGPEPGATEAIPRPEVLADDAARDDEGRPAPGPGAMLCAAREARGLSQRDLADTMNLSVSTIRALEEDDYERLPRSAFVRGYLRSYARLLTIAPEPLLDAYEARVGRFDPKLEVAEAVRSRPPPVTAFVHERPGLVMTLASLAGLVVLLAALAAIWPDQAPPPAAVAASPPAPPGFQASARAVEADARPAAGMAGNTLTAAADAPPPVAGRTADREPGARIQAAVAAASPADVPAPPGAQASTTAAVAEDAVAPAPPTPGDAAPATAGRRAVTREVDATGRSIRILAGGEDHLQLSFSSDCWVEVRDADGVGVYGDLNREG
ncbi:MAG: helix-turn-helix domain-containing protein, partial [Pseudomonadales bacterium]|nr:helix-turn-helix domain-containing protein [Pseudomonadales bacterium]